MNDEVGPAPVVVGILYPEWYHGDDEWQELDERLRAVDPRIQVIRCGYEETSELRNARSSGSAMDRAPAAPALTDDQRAALADVEVVIAMDLPVGVAELAPRLRWVQGVGAGVGQLASAGLEVAGIRLSSGAGVSATSISEFVIARLLQIWKDTDRLGELQQRHEWTPSHGRTLAGATVGLVGLGAIGCELATRLSAFGVEVIGCRRRPDAGAIEGVGRIVGTDQLDGLLASADIVVSAVPETPETIDLFDSRRFSVMRSGAVFVNVGRGSVVVEPDLIDALSDGRLRAAVLDVTRTEPLPQDDPLWDAPRLFLSPHSSASVDDYMVTLHRLFRDNLARYLAGEPLRNEVDPGLGY